MEKVAIVIPIYKSQLNPEEEISLLQCMKVLGKHPIRFVAPASLNLSFLSTWIDEIQSIRFNDDYFKSPKTYNKLLTLIYHKQTPHQEEVEHKISFLEYKFFAHLLQ